MIRIIEIAIEIAIEIENSYDISRFDPDGCVSSTSFTSRQLSAIFVPYFGSLNLHSSLSMSPSNVFFVLKGSVPNSLIIPWLEVDV